MQVSLASEIKYTCTYLRSRNRDTYAENKCMDTGGKWAWDELRD